MAWIGRKAARDRWASATDRGVCRGRVRRRPAGAGRCGSGGRTVVDDVSGAFCNRPERRALGGVVP